MLNIDPDSEYSWENCLAGEAGHFLPELAFPVTRKTKYPPLHSVISLACCPTHAITTITGPYLFWV